MVVQYCAVVNDGVGGPDGFMQVAAQVDGVNIPPGEVDFANHTELIDSRCFMWVAVDVLAGPRTVRMMWRTLNSNQVSVDQRNMLVQYKR